MSATENKKLLFTFLSLFFALFMLLFPRVIFCQVPTYYLNPEKSLVQYNTQSWTTNEGLPTNSLLSIFQSSDGFLWIGSYDGLIRFDGHEFKVFNKRNTQIFTSNTIRGIAEDSKGTLWMTTQGNGLMSYKEGVFTRFGDDNGISHFYQGIFIDSLDRVWAATPNKGWFYFENGKFHFLTHTSSLLNSEVRTIAQTPDGSIWFGTFGNGLYRYQNKIFTQYTKADGLISDWIYSLYSDSKGTLWIGQVNGLSVFDGKKFIHYNQLSGNTVNDIFEDRYHNYWIASNQGLFRLKSDTGLLEELTTQSGLPNDFINDFLIDQEGNAWMAYYKGGLAELKDGKFLNYTMDGGLSGKVVNAICELEPGKFLTAFDNGEFNIIRDNKILPHRFKTDLSDQRIRHIMLDTHKNLWISTYSGILKITPSGQETWMNEKTGFPESRIRLTFEDSKGNIWVGTRNNGLIKINNDKTYTRLSASNGLTANLIMSIDEDKEGNILVGTSEGEGGFNIIADDKVVKTFSSKDGIASNVVFNTYVDQEGVIWVAALGGLVCIRDNKVISITVKEGLLADSPFDVVEDGHGYLWLPCNKGIMRVRKQEVFDLTEGKINQVACRLFDKHDGMADSECNPTSKSLKAADGSLLFPTLNGLAQIYPSLIPRNNYKPPVHLLELLVDNQSVPLTSQHVFLPGKKRFTFFYTAISLYEPRRVQFKYMLEGFDDNWVEANGSRSISYTNLTHGNYTFRVIACNNDGVWNTDGANYSFSIKPRFVDTFWFYLLVFLGIAGIVYLFYHIRIRQLKRKQEELERIIDKRTHEIREKNNTLEEKNAEIEAQAEFLQAQKHELNILNASKDKMFSIIAHDLRGPLGNFRTMLEIMVNAPEEFNAEEQKRMLLLLSDNAKTTYELLENLLNWSSSQRGVITYEPKIVDAKPIILDILGFVQPMASNKQITIEANMPEELELYADENMLRAILRNLLGNAIKFTRIQGRIELNCEREGNFIRFGVKDNGVGIKPEIKDKLFNHLEQTVRLGTAEEKGSGLGLLLCKEFIEKHGGQIWLESKLGYGSTFFFTIPVSKFK
ncbi:MAG: hypothetical protein IPM71_09495 [Bacteroidota bacterium]|nr:MAG: hypothetical protein IPM71_09495 [Bacteroidota bacterium]